MTSYYFNNSFKFPTFSHKNYDFPKLKRMTDENTGERFYNGRLWSLPLSNQKITSKKNLLDKSEIIR